MAKKVKETKDNKKIAYIIAAILLGIISPKSSIIIPMTNISITHFKYTEISK